MQFKQTLVRLSFLLIPSLSYSQTTYLPQGARENTLLERLEIKRGTDSVLNFSKNRPFSRRQVIPHLARLDSANLSTVDHYNLQLALQSNIEWAPGTPEQYPSRRRLWKHFYKTPANLYEVHARDFFLAINPVFQYTVGKEADSDQHLFLNTRGVSLRGRIADKIGFSAYVTDNQERDPLYVQDWEEERQAVPGQGFYKEFKRTGYDYFDARGTITFNVAKYIDVAFGYDKNFIGHGQRSLFLSDFSNSALFLRLNTRIWKFNYQNLFMELQTAERTGADVLIPKKYAAMHHLDLGVTKWLNIGLFEGVIFGRPDRFEFGYLNPVIFYRSIEQQNGSFDNAVAGLDAKANVAGKFQFYTQFLLDEFNLTEIRRASGWWGNKWGWQLGANFQEFIATARYQPSPRWLINARAFYAVQGKDTGSVVSYGGNIFLPNVPPYRTMDFGYEMAEGVRTKTAYASLLLSYEFRPNLFFEVNPVVRKVSATVAGPARNTVVVNAGLRWNMHRRDFDF